VATLRDILARKGPTSSPCAYHTVLHAANLMNSRASAVSSCSGGPVGIFTERDVLRRVRHGRDPRRHGSRTS
jgi:CBS domain-containing protein